MQRVIMIGNCQIQSLYGLYLRFAERSAGQNITYIRSYEDISDDARLAIQAADIVIEQVQDFKPTADIAGIPTNAKRIPVPVVNAGFLWPFAGQPHPNNPIRPFCEGGPYGAESSDSYLNRMIKKGVEPESAVQQYADLDMNSVVNLDRMYEMSMDKQRQRDEATGFKIADVIATHLRDEPVFRTPYHPNLRVAMSLATQLFERMDVHRADIDRMRRSIRVTPFPKEELPFHPSVRRHFGLRFVTDDHRYRFMNEGYFTFEEFALRYMNCTWNEPLEEGLALTRRGELKAARERLLAGLALTPHSAEGRSALSTVLDGLGEPEEAILEVRRAIAADPEQAQYRTQLGVLLARAGNMEAAEQQMRLAAALDPFDPHFPGLLANQLGRQGHVEEALAVIRQGLACNPRATNLLLGFGDLLARSGQTGEAENAIREAIRWAPNESAPLKALAKLLGDIGQADQAAALWQRVLAMDSNNLDIHIQHIDTLLRSGDFARTEQAARSAIERFPAAGQLHNALSQALKRSNRLDDALEAARTATTLESGNVQFHSHLADLLIDKRRFEEAERQLRCVIATGRQNGHTYFQLGVVLAAMGRYSDAVTACRDAVRVEPDNPHRHAQLGQMLIQANDHSNAEYAIRTAIALSPETAAFHDDLSHFLSHTGRQQEAIEAAQHALALEPDNARFRGHFCDLINRRENSKGLE